MAPPQGSKEIADTREPKPKVPAERIRDSRLQAQRPVLDLIIKGEGTVAESQNTPDLVKGIALLDLPDAGKLVGHCGDEQKEIAEQFMPQSLIYATV